MAPESIPGPFFFIYFMFCFKFHWISFVSIKLFLTFASPFKKWETNYVTKNQDKIAVIRPQSG